MKKILFALTLMIILAPISYSEITVEELRSAEYLRNDGYSEEMIKQIQINSDEYKPKPSNIFQTIGFKIWNYFDPDSPKSRNDIRHDIKPYSSYSDL